MKALKTKSTGFLLAALLTVSGSLSVGAAGNAKTEQQSSGKDARAVFDEETFGGNGRTCVTCHSSKTGTFSIDEAQKRFAKDPNDPLFRSPDSDNLAGQSFNRLLTTGRSRSTCRWPQMSGWSPIQPRERRLFSAAHRQRKTCQTCNSS